MRRSSEEDIRLERIKQLFALERFHTHTLIRTTNPEQLLKEYEAAAFLAFDTKDGGATFPLPSAGYSEDLIKDVLDELNNAVRKVMQEEPNRHIRILVMNERSEEELEKLCVQRFVAEKEAEEKGQETATSEDKKKQEEESKWRRINEKIEAELAKRQTKSGTPNEGDSVGN